MTKPTSATTETKATSEKTRSQTTLQQLTANVFLNSGEPVIEHLLNQSKPGATVYGKLKQVQ